MYYWGNREILHLVFCIVKIHRNDRSSFMLNSELVNSRAKSGPCGEAYRECFPSVIGALMPVFVCVAVLDSEFAFSLPLIFVCLGGWWRWALVSPDGVTPIRMVDVSASVSLPLHHKVQKFSSGTGSPGWSRKKGRKMVVMWWLFTPCWHFIYVYITLVQCFASFITLILFMWHWER